eukprot:TRINITY_DN10065_c0_g1_i1.p1 TRINITY_DN10065_c0_g1~~TRINITY_DN10065_c0_g1_i1.p1  ORF type:complete len:480 (+),score=23.22 TRINITY_DN10065_c0_g1_i1:66-1505(+)
MVAPAAATDTADDQPSVWHPKYVRHRPAPPPPATIVQLAEGWAEAIPEPDAKRRGLTKESVWTSALAATRTTATEQFEVWLSGHPPHPGTDLVKDLSAGATDADYPLLSLSASADVIAHTRRPETVQAKQTLWERRKVTTAKGRPPCQPSVGRVAGATIRPRRKTLPTPPQLLPSSVGKYPQDLAQKCSLRQVYVPIDRPSGLDTWDVPLYSSFAVNRVFDDPLQKRADEMRRVLHRQRLSKRCDNCSVDCWSVSRRKDGRWTRRLRERKRGEDQHVTRWHRASLAAAAAGSTPPRPGAVSAPPAQTSARSQPIVPPLPLPPPQTSSSSVGNDSRVIALQPAPPCASTARAFTSCSRPSGAAEVGLPPRPSSARRPRDTPGASSAEPAATPAGDSVEPTRYWPLATPAPQRVAPAPVRPLSAPATRRPVMSGSAGCVAAPGETPDHTLATARSCSRETGFASAQSQVRPGSVPAEASPQ